MTEGLAIMALVFMIVAGLLLLAGAAATPKANPTTTTQLASFSGNGYPNGSVPYTAEESPALRAKRVACAAVNHYPRSYTGSWCFGYGYVCGRCYMYADPWPKGKAESVVESLGPNPDQMDIARACGGGPPR